MRPYCEILIQLQRTTITNADSEKIFEGLRAIHCFARDNVIGGTTVLTDRHNTKVLEHELSAGETVILDGNMCLHHTTPMKSTGRGTRDVVILSHPAAHRNVSL